MKKLVKFICGLAIFGMVFILGCYTLAYSSGEPNINRDRYITMYDNQDTVFYQSINNYSGQYVDLEDISSYFLESIVAIEDHRFYEHRGFDPISIMRAVKVNLTNQDKSQGASSITQQYARLLYLTNEKSWSRKAKEAFLTMQLETHLTKDEILEGYVNNVYFGHGIYGIENAAKYFYNKSAKDLNLNESSMLAGVVNGPGYFSPLTDETAARNRQSIVLQRMVEQEIITSEQKDKVLASDLELSEEHTLYENMSYYYYKDTVMQELEELGFSSDTYINQGLNIYTSLDPGYQKQLEESTTEQTKDSELETSSIIIEPYTSKILAIIGGKDYTNSQFNRATDASRHIGSTIKPFLYYLALENGFTPSTTFLAEPTSFKLPDGSTYSPTNYSNKYAYQEITMAQAIAVSDNIYAVKTHMFLGEDNLAKLMEKFGYEDVPANPSLALGTLDTNIYGLANMYNTLASEGEYTPIYTIETIINDAGDVLYERENQSEQLLDKDSTLVLNQLLTGTFNSTFSTYLSATMEDYELDSTYAVKTGTTDYDSLAVGYNPNILVASWVGYDDNSPVTTYEERVVSKQIMVDILEYTDEQKKSKWYKPTKNIQEIGINPLTGDVDENGPIYWFKKE
ncbi:MAG: transglycosylase domain-containing protein [Coprobacillaceae bacterium]